MKSISSGNKQKRKPLTRTIKATFAALAISIVLVGVTAAPAARIEIIKIIFINQFIFLLYLHCEKIPELQNQNCFRQHLRASPRIKI